MVTILQYHFELKNRDRQYRESEKKQNNKTGVDSDFRTGLEKLRPKRSASNEPRTLQNRQYAQKKYREYKNAE